MEQRDKDTLRKEYVKLRDALQPQISDICHRLYSMNIINGTLKEEILEGHRLSHEKTEALLDLLPRRGPNAFEALYQASIETESFDAADLLRPERGPHHNPSPEWTTDVRSPSATDGGGRGGGGDDDELPQYWPDEKAIEEAKNVRVIDEKKDHDLVKLFQASLQDNQESFYRMTHKKRGRVLVFNNEKFANLPNRKGTLYDRKGIEKLFNEFDFNVNVLRDNTAAQMRQALEDEKTNKEHIHADCFVLFILTHGYKGIVYGVDGVSIGDRRENYLEIKEIRDLVCKIPDLKGKPKLIFIQACQGQIKDGSQPTDVNVGTESPAAKEEASALDDAHDKDTTDHTTVKDVVDHTPVKDVAESKTGSDRRDGVIDDEEATAVKEVLLDLNPPDRSDSGEQRETPFFQSDVFVAMATTADMLSYRNINHGTWFIQAIVYIFSKFAYKHDLMTLMMLVNRLVSKAQTVHGDRQVGEKTDTFNRQFYFFPGLYTDKPLPRANESGPNTK